MAVVICLLGDIGRIFVNDSVLAVVWHRVINLLNRVICTFNDSTFIHSAQTIVADRDSIAFELTRAGFFVSLTFYSIS